MLTRPDWAWCIATYNRHDMLERTCALALAQSVPPAEIVITDASADWDSGQARISHLVDAAVAAGAAGGAAARAVVAAAADAGSGREEEPFAEPLTPRQP